MKTWKQTIRNGGSITSLDNLTDGDGSRVGRAFCERLVEEFSRYSVTHHKATGDLPFVYRERQLCGGLLISIARFVECVLAEQPVDRDIRGSNSAGWIDCWALYRNTTFLLEIKHGYSAEHSAKGVRQDLKNKWAEACRQFTTISRQQLREHLSGNNQRPVVKLPLLVVTHFLQSKSEEKVLTSYRLGTAAQLLGRHHRLRKGVGFGGSKAPTWSALWRVHDNLVTAHKQPYGYELYPAVSFFARVESLR